MWIDVLRQDVEARRCAVATAADEVLAAGVQRFEDVEAFDAAAGATTPVGFFVQRDHDGRAAERLHDLAGYDADDARVPLLGSEHQDAVFQKALRLAQRLLENLLLLLLALSVGRLQHLRQTAGFFVIGG